MGNFLVYKSSAGSGKTFTLMINFIKIALTYPERFRNILAITFTNKAANEIKQRILSNLYALSKRKETDKKTQLLNILISETNLTEAQIISKANDVYKLILHNYSDFAVSTIDSFMHKVIRSFTFDLKISNNFNVDIDEDKLISKLIDMLLLDVGADNLTTELLLNFIEQNIEDDKSVNLRNDLTTVGENIWKENVFTFIDKMQEINIQQLFSVIAKVNEKIRVLNNTLASKAKKALELLENNSITIDDLRYKKTGIYAFYKNIAEGNFSYKNKNAHDTAHNDLWCSSSVSHQAKISIENIKNDLSSIYFDIIEYVENNIDKYVVYDNFKSNIYLLALLTAMIKKLQIVKNEDNIIPISEFNKILSNIIANESVPFIYERIGEKYKHFLIDEFQDTSVLQWHNLLPLIENSLSNNNLNMIVGDAKQSIYRFRNGNVDQFVNLPYVSNPENSLLVAQRAEALKQNFEQRALRKNWRSKCEIIDFNNNFFAFFAPLSIGCESLIYDDIEQDTDLNNTGGGVIIEFFDKENYKENVFEKTISLINEIISKGYDLSDIAILCYDNAKAKLVSEFLIERGIAVSSANSLKLTFSPDINFLISWFSIIADYSTELSKTAIINYLFLNKYITNESFEKFCYDISNDNFYLILGANNLTIDIENIKKLSLYDIAEYLIDFFDLKRGGLAYLQSFLDIILNFSIENGNSPYSFIHFWNNNNKQFNVDLPKNKNTIEVLTVHKSKGLEFNFVIMPFAEQNKRIANDYAFVQIDDEMLEGINIIQLRLNEKLSHTKFASIYENEQWHSNLDRLNNMYVAFTRAINYLYIFSETPPKTYNNNSFAAVITKYLSENKMYRENNNLYVFGNKDIVYGKTIEANNVHAKVFNYDFNYFEWTNKLEYIYKAPDVWNVESPTKYWDKGNIIHYALSYIFSSSDINYSIEQLIIQGLIMQNDAPDLENQLNYIVTKSDASQFFSPNKIAYNEQEILDIDGRSYIPDKVIVNDNFIEIIDYKTGLSKNSDIEQIRKYKSLLLQLSNVEVRGYLLYISDKVKIVEVEN